MKWLLCFVFLSTIFIPVFSQSIYQKREKGETSGSDFDIGSLPELNEIPSQMGFNFSINADEYFVDSGDMFIIKVDRQGPALKIYNSPVTPDGYIALPDIEAIKIRGKLLVDAKKSIKNKLRKKYPNASIEIYLYNLHNINITLLGPENINNKMILNSSNRLFDAYSRYSENLQLDSTKQILLDRLSLRNVKLIRKNNATSYDLLEFKVNFNHDLNPYLRHEDIVYFSFKDSLAHHVSVKGAVINPTTFEFKAHDELKTAIAFSGGLIPGADSSKIVLSRFYENSKIENIQLSLPKDSSFQLQPDDRIYVRNLKQYHIKSSVEIIGEVSFPGEYSILDGEIHISDLISLAGGFTKDASLSNAKILREIGDYVDKEFERLNVPSQREMTKVEQSYVRLRNRENSTIVSCDFKRLFLEKDKKQDALLQDKDVITIPKKSLNIFVSGGVINPGVIKYHENMNYEEYIELAGGYSPRSKESSVKIIRNKVGNWIDADEDIVIEENDIIFVPVRDEIEFYDIMREGLAISAQLATLVLIFLNLK